MMAHAVVGTGHQSMVSLMREDVPKSLDTACGRRMKNHCRNGLSARGHAWPIPETNNNDDKSVNCDLVKMRDRSFLTINGDCDHETVSGGRKRAPKSAFDSAVNGEITGSRKRRRKNCRPQCLMQLSRDESFIKEDLEEYHVNNNGVDFDAVAADDEEEILDLTCIKKQENTNGWSNGDCGEQLVADTSAVDSEVICGDSKVLEQDGTQLVHVEAKNEDEKGDHGIVETVPSGDPEVVETVPSGADAAAAAIKDYAESTMNELLSIYGLNEDHGESITRRVPLLNFTPSNILGREQPSFPSTPMTLQITSNSLSSDMLTRSVEANVGESTGVALSAASPSLTSEDIYAKFMDSMEKLAQMPQGT